MSDLARLLQWTADLLLAGLGVLTIAEWIHQRTRARAEFALAFGLLATAASVRLIIEQTATQSVAVEDLALLLFLASGYAFLRFRHALIPLGQRALHAAETATAVVAVAVVVASIPAGSPPLVTPFQSLMIILVALVWSISVGEPVVKFWHVSQRLPAVQAGRLRALALGYGGIILILLVAVLLGPTARTPEFQVGGQLVALALMPFLYVGIAPPRLLRSYWRQKEEQALRDATLELVQFAKDAETLAQKSLPWALRLVGADAGFIVTSKGHTLAAHNIDANQIAAFLAAVGEPPEYAVVTGVGTRRRDTAVVVAIPSRFGRAYLGTVSGPFTPIFGSDEIGRLIQYKNAFAAGLDRVELTTMIRMLNEVATAANDSTSISEVTAKVLAEVRRYTGWPLAHAYYPTVPAHKAATNVWSGSPDFDFAEFRAVTEEVAGHPATRMSQVLSEGRTTTTNNLGGLDNFIRLPQAEAAGLNAGFWFPIHSNQDVVGVLEFFSDESAVPDVSVIHALETVGGALGRVYERAGALTAAAEASAAKSEYLSRISHELRTPLTVIIGYADLLNLHCREEDKGPLTAILNSSEHLLRLVNDVLDISRIEAGSEPLTLEATSVEDLFERCLKVSRPMGEMSGMQITCAVPEGIPPVLGDRQRITQIMVNLVSNAIKYGAAGQVIELTARERSSGRIRLAVSDHGPGIAEDDLPRLFLPFERANPERTSVAGTGLGLAVVKRFVEAMGGTVGVDTAVGDGSTFWVDLNPANLPTVELAGHATGLTLDAGPTADVAPAETVLYVEDDVPTMELIARLIRMRPVSLVTATTGAEAIQLAGQHPPNLMILDLHLPDMSGEEVLSHIRRDPATSNTPVIVLSADATTHHIDRALNAGASRYLTKPISITDFLQALDEGLKAGRRTRV